MKILKVKDCVSCKLRKYEGPQWANDYKETYICSLTEYAVDDRFIDIFPDWCPLEDYKSEKS